MQKAYFPTMNLLLFFLFFISTEGIIADDQLPEHGEYVPGESNYRQYQTHSLLGTDSFVLTFDDGPHPIYTPKVLDLLKKYQVKATFFVIGERINSQTSPIINRIINEGHILASHDWTHDNNNHESLYVFKEGVKKSLFKLEEFLQNSQRPHPGYYFRFPYAAYGQSQSYHHFNVLWELSHEIFNDNCLHFVFWDNDSSDWVPGISSDEILQNFKAFYRGGIYYSYKIRNGKITKIKSSIPNQQIESVPEGGVILFHDMYQKTVDALAKILHFAQNSGITFTELNQLPEFGYGPHQSCRVPNLLK